MVTSEVSLKDYVHKSTYQGRRCATTAECRVMSSLLGTLMNTPSADKLVPMGPIYLLGPAICYKVVTDQDRLSCGSLTKMRQSLSSR